MEQGERVEAATRVLPDLPKGRVGVIGDLVVDEYIYGRTDRISREAPVLIVRQESTERKLGGAANAAANLAALGSQTVLIGAIGDDEAGRSLSRLCDEAGIEGRFQVGAGPTETKIRILAGGINTTRQQMLRLDKGREAPLDAAAEEALVASLREVARELDVLVVSDYGAGVCSPRVVEAIRGLAAEGLRVCVDSRYQLAAFEGVFLAKPNEPELREASGLPVGALEQTVAAGDALRQRMRSAALLVTRGRSGMVLLQEGEAPDVIPVHGDEDAVDVTGAGDSVIATLSACLAAGAPLPLAARVANVAGGLVVRKPGTATIDAAELIRELRREARP